MSSQSQSQEELQHQLALNTSVIFRSINNNNDNNSSSNSNSDEGESAAAFVHRALSSLVSRHRRALLSGFERFIVKRNNFPNNQLTRGSDEDDDSNELELDAIEDGESDDDDDYSDREEDDKVKSSGIDRLDVEEADGDLDKATKMYVPYWDAYDTVNQLFLEMSEYRLPYHVSSYCGNYIIAF
jgi:hypothetical protein